MTIAGTIYGVILNDLSEREGLAAAFMEKPYQSPPQAPVVYIKPRQCLTVAGAPVVIPDDVEELEAAPTLGLLFARDAYCINEASVWAMVGAACLALDISIPQASYYRPAIAQRCRDGFLPIGAFAGPPSTVEIVTSVDGEEVHRWSTDRLVRPVSRLISDLSAFMTLRAGDMLLVGLPGDAPRVRTGQAVHIMAQGLPPLTTVMTGGRA